LVRRDTLLVLDLGFNVIDGVGRLDLKSDSLAGQCLDEDLHTTTQAKDEVKSRLLLNVLHWSASRPSRTATLTVVRKGTTILKLLSSKDQTLLVRRDTLLVLDLGLDVVDGVGRLDLESDCLAGEAEKSEQLRVMLVELTS
jgi:D-ribose pyranose/furanose isomerase RbsD